MAGRKKDLPLVYSCSGCSSAAQMANHVALRLDREGEAEMSCIAGVGGNVPHLVRIAQSGRPILAIDGCALECTRSSLAQRGVQPARHMLLNEQGVGTVHGSAFGLGSYLRIAYALDDASLQKACRALETFVRGCDR